MKKFAIGFGKFLLTILTLILCLCLTVSLLVTVLVADVQILTQKDNLNTLITGYLTGSKMPHRQGLPAGISVQTGGKMAPVKKLDDISVDMGDMSNMTDGSFLVTFIYDMMQEEAGGQLDVSLEEVEAFVEESTLDDFLAEKSASLVSDFITGENTTSFTVEEIVQQLEQNAALIENTFNVTIDETVIQEVKTSVEESGVVEKIDKGGLQAVLEMSSGSEFMPDEDLSGMLGTGTNSTTTTTQKLPTNLIDVVMALVNGELDLSKMSLPQILNMFRAAVSAETLWICIGVSALLIGLIFLASWSKYYRAMTEVGITILDTGVVFMIPWILLKTMPDLIATLLGADASILALIGTMLGMLNTLHLVLIGVGVALIIAGSILGHVEKKHHAHTPEATKTEEAAEEMPALEVETSEEEAAVEEETPEEAAVEEETPEEAAVAEETPAEEAPAEEAPVEETV